MDRIKKLIPKKLKRLIFPLKIRKAFTSLFYKTAILTKPQFEGWGMSSKNKPPSLFEEPFGKSFANDNNEIIELIKDGDFKLSQFGSIENQLENLEILQWRHYVIQSTLKLQIERALSNQKEIYISEFGVCDGLTAWYALKLLDRNKINFEFNLFDAWAGMRSKDLYKSESTRVGDYDYLEIDNTKKNLAQFKKNCNWIKGYLPETLPSLGNTKKLSWIHIDLNSAKLTVDVLNHYLEFLDSGSLVILDDYGHIGFSDTRKSVDLWIEKKSGKVYSIISPTGQGIIFWK